jgi:hypothetical protein
MSDEGKLVYIIKTNVPPTFFKGGIMNIQKSAGRFMDFLTETQMLIDNTEGGVPELKLPILAITDKGYHTPLAFQDILNTDRLPNSAREIYEILSRAIEGKEVGCLQSGRPVSAIIDFTNSSPELLGAYERLTQSGYNVRKIERIGTEI